MKNFIAVLVVLAVLVTVSARQVTFASDDASINEVSSVDASIDDVSTVVSDDEQEPPAEETVEEQLPYEVVIDNRPTPSTEEYVPPETAGTIVCSGKGPTMRVDISGNLMIGLSSIVPLKMITRISLTKEGRACWGRELWSGCALTQAICVKGRDKQLTCQPRTDAHATFRNVPRTSFVPQIGGYASFDLNRWKVVGCVREGCDGVCHEGEKCRPGPGCTINGK